MRLLSNPIILIFILVIFVYIGRCLNIFLFKSTVMQDFHSSMKRGFGLELSLKIVERLHGVQGVDVVKEKIARPCDHHELVKDESCGEVHSQHNTFYCISCGKKILNSGLNS